MAAELLHEMMNRSEALSVEEKRRLAEYLRDQASGTDPLGSSRHNGSRADAEKHMAWLRANREEYSGQYVALLGDKLVGSGSTRKEALDAARSSGVVDPFVVYVLSANVLADGGF
jgi:hypothetical protein